MHTAADQKKPMRSLSKFSYNKEELLGGEGRSRYGPAATLDRFHEALDLNHLFPFFVLTISALNPSSSP